MTFGLIKNNLNTPATNQIYLPVIFPTQNTNFKDEFNRLIQQKNPVILDTFLYQLSELIRIEHSSRIFSEEELQTAVLNRLQDKESDFCGNWIYYPWKNTLVHLLDKEDFIRVRTNRNQNKITITEQAQLQSKTIGIIGLSVGNAVALTMACERICGKLKLADFDDLDLSNLNRIRAGVTDLGLAKTVITARAIAELDPYLEIEIFKEGIHSGNLESFLSENGKLDLLVEVCDNLDIKVESRLHARKQQIPVVMDTSDRGMVDIERFDKEPERALFHGLVSEVVLNNYQNLSKKDTLPILMQLISFENASIGLKNSVGEIGKTILTWPQLASSVILGGGVTCDVSRRILLGQEILSGRYYFDIESFI